MNADTNGLHCSVGFFIGKIARKYLLCIEFKNIFKAISF